MATITKGTRIIVRDRYGFDHYGFVDNAINYGTTTDPDWYVEWYDTMWKGYHYTKQKIDRVERIQFRQPE